MAILAKGESHRHSRTK